MSQKKYNKITERKVKTKTTNEKSKFLHDALQNGNGGNNNSWNAQLVLKNFIRISMDLGFTFGRQKDIQNVINIICTACKQKIKPNKALEQIIKMYGSKMLEGLLKEALYIVSNGNKRHNQTAS